LSIFIVKFLGWVMRARMGQAGEKPPPPRRRRADGARLAPIARRPVARVAQAVDTSSIVRT
jgi:hypothetical protein